MDVQQLCLCSRGIPLAKSKPSATAEELEQGFFDLVKSLETHPVAVRDLIVDNNVLYNLATNSLYATSSWKNTTMIVDMLQTRNIDNVAFLEFVAQEAPVNNVTLLAIASIYPPLEEIHSSDRTPAARAGSYERILPAIYQLSNISKVAGRGDFSLTMACAQWKLDVKERYDGDFHVNPKNPVLLIGNTYDGHTPLKSAYDVSSGLKGSAVLEIDGNGHTSLQLPSLCTAKLTGDYWMNGTLPKSGTVCKVDASPFSNVTWASLLEGKS